MFSDGTVFPCSWCREEKDPFSPIIISIDKSRWLARIVVLQFALSFVTSTAAGEAYRLRLGYFPNITHAQALYARATGDFEKRIGIPIQWIAFNAGPTAIESLFTDQIDATFVGPGPTINGYIKSKGEKFAVIAGCASGGAGLVIRKDSGIKSVHDFANKLIATPQIGNTQDVAARTWFAKNGYMPRERGGDLGIIALSNPDQLTMLKKKQIDGAWTIEPWLSRLEVEAGAQLFLEEKALWPDGKYVTTHLVMNRSFCADNKIIHSKLIDALVEVTDRINSDKNAAIPIINAQLKKETGKALKDAVIRRSMDRVELTWNPIQSSLFAGAASAHQIGFLKQKPALDGIYSLSALNEVLAARHLPLVEVREKAEKMGK